MVRPDLGFSVRVGALLVDARFWNRGFVRRSRASVNDAPTRENENDYENENDWVGDDAGALCAPAFARVGALLVDARFLESGVRPTVAGARKVRPYSGNSDEDAGVGERRPYGERTRMITRMRTNGWTMMRVCRRRGVARRRPFFGSGGCPTFAGAREVRLQ